MDMGLIKAAMRSAGGVLADQWKEYFYCDSLPGNVLMRRGRKRVSGRGSNQKGNDNVISNGSVIAVADGQCMILVDQGKITEFCAEPGEFTYDSSTEPSLFSGDLGQSLADTFVAMGRRFTFGGDTAREQRVYYINTKELLDNKFGTPTPILFEVVNKRIGMSRTVNLRFNGVYTYRIADPLLFYTRLAGNVAEEYTREQIDGQLKADFIDALQPAVGVLSEQELRPAQLPAKARELKAAMNAELGSTWGQRGISIEKISLNPITLTDGDMKKINELEDAATMGANPYMMAGRMTDATANAMETAAGNSAGAITGFMGMGQVAGSGGFAAAQGFYQMGQQQQQAQQAAPAPTGWNCSCGKTGIQGNFCPECGSKKPQPKPAAGWTCPSCGATATGNFCPECGTKKPEASQGWVCGCGAVNKGKFCPQCGAKKPAGVPQFKCDKCGWEPADPTNPPKFCPECGDPFDAADVK